CRQQLVADLTPSPPVMPDAQDVVSLRRCSLQRYLLRWIVAVEQHLAHAGLSRGKRGLKNLVGDEPIVREPLLPDVFARVISVVALGGDILVVHAIGIDDRPPTPRDFRE